MSARVRVLVIAAVALVAAAASGGCATVKPWDRDLLAKESMKYAPLPIESAADEHIYFSKEGSTGGTSVGGGGCGCN